MNSLYRKILTKAWLFTKKYKSLWLLGPFLALLGSAAEYQNLFTQFDRLKNNPETYQSVVYYINLYGQVLINWWRMPLAESLALILLLLFYLLILFIIFALAFIAQAAIIKAIENEDTGKKVTIKDCIIHGANHFWSVVGINVISKALIFIVLTLFITPLISTLLINKSNTGVILAFLTLIIFVPIAIIVGFVSKYAVAYLIIKKEKMWTAFVNGWRLFVANWLISIEMAFFVLIINMCLVLVVSLIGLVVVSPLLLVAMATYSREALAIVINISLAFIIVLFIFTGSVFSVWQNSAWTMLFLRLETGQALPKIIRWLASKLLKK